MDSTIPAGTRSSTSTSRTASLCSLVAAAKLMTDASPPPRSSSRSTRTAPSDARMRFRGGELDSAAEPACARTHP